MSPLQIISLMPEAMGAFQVEKINHSIFKDHIFKIIEKLQMILKETLVLDLLYIIYAAKNIKTSLRASPN